MKIIEVKNLAIPEIKVIRFARFCDHRGYFTEHFRKNDFFKHPSLKSMKSAEFVQANQSYSKKDVIRGLHFQWNPYMGKLVRTISGNMVDLILDIRKYSPTFGKIIAYEMPSSEEKDYDEWIWVPPGFAHGNYFKENSIIEYFCSGEYNPNCEAGISPLSKDINWNLCDENLKKEFDEISSRTVLITEKDREGFSLTDWENDERSNNFIYSELKGNGFFEAKKQNKILFTGERGLLGRKMKKLVPRALFPTRDEFDITNYEQMNQYLKDKKINLIIHAAAFTSPPLIEKDPLKAIETNIIGTANVVKLCKKDNIKLIYLSTDYVFKGDKGNYKEEEDVNPRNKYAWSKLGGECAVRMHDNSLIIRTSFGPNEFPYEKAFVDQWTSRERVSEIAKKIVKVLERDIKGIIHLGGNRKTVFEYAKELNPSKEIGKSSIKEVKFEVPIDTSLNCEKYNELFEGGKL